MMLGVPAFSLGAAFRAGFFATVPGAAVAGGLALAPLMGLAGIASIRPRAIAKVFAEPRVEILFLLSFLGWAIASTLWSINPDHGQALRLAATALPGLCFAALNTERRVVEAAGLAAMIVLIVMLALEAGLDMPLNRGANPSAETWLVARNPSRAATVGAVLVWGAIGALIARGGVARLAVAVLITAAVCALTWVTSMDANRLAFVTGTFVFVAAFAAPRVLLLVVSGALALWQLAAPFLTPLQFAPAAVERMPDSWAIRGEIWRFASARIAESPFVGYGLDAARAFPDRIDVRGAEMHALPLHTHSFSFQVWLETGGVGAVLAAAALLSGGLALARGLGGNRPAAAAAAATLACVGLIANVSFGAWQEWWIATMCAAAALVAAIPTTSAKA